jgi:hypothetical protein
MVLPLLVNSVFGLGIFSHPNYGFLKPVLTAMLIASRLGYKHQLALGAVPR